jgi:hypothetical protein
VGCSHPRLDGPDSLQGGDDSFLQNVWEEFAHQIQEQQSVLFEIYEEMIVSHCAAAARKLSEAELALLWLDSEGYWQNWDDTPVNPDLGKKIEDVTGEVYRRVASRAADQELDQTEQG